MLNHYFGIYFVSCHSCGLSVSLADGTAVSELKTECKLLSAVFVADRPRVCLRLKFSTNKVVCGSKLTGLVHAKVSEC